jgi:hypothetical protein
MVVSLVTHCDGLQTMMINSMDYIITPATNAQSITAMAVVTRMMMRRRRMKKLFFEIAIIAEGTTVLSV